MSHQRPLDLFIMLQKAAGYFELNEELAKQVNVPLSQLQAKSPTNLGIDATLVSRTWATAIALVALEHKFAEFQEEWELLAEKAERWMMQQIQTLSKMNTAADWKAQAKARVL